jgi:uncharacterized protein (TIGR00369 family)
VTADGLSIDQLKKFMANVFAPWVQQLNIEPAQITSTGAVFKVPENQALTRKGGITCGQAISAVADTAGVLALFAHNADPRIMTTVDMTTHFTRPLMTGEIEATVTILSNGRRMATTRADFRQAGSAKICAAATCAYAYVDQ